MTDLPSDRAARQDIAELLVRYASAIDRRDWALLRTCFTDDCRADYGDIGVWDGVEAITAYMTRSHATLGHTLHRITNQAVTVGGDRASARSYVDAVLMAADGDSGLNAVGFYDDELVRVAGEWRIARRRFTMVRLGPV
ncbi:MAG TPA: nuclear transport factor 2 family protein [Acidimicrobiales bacterium]|nr:nuclear transport factor 2 family protein [Acidimicrobiales bacterium]